METPTTIEIPHPPEEQLPPPQQPPKKKKIHYPRIGKKVGLSDDEPDILNDNSLKFDELIVRRRAALGLLPNVQDPESKQNFRLSDLKSSRFYEFGDGFKTAFNSGGYRLCRSNRGFISEGKYYWEMIIISANPDSHCRFGITTLRAGLDVPVGYDDRGYCVCDKGGAYHNRILTPNTPQFGMGDKIGIGLSISKNSEDKLVGEMNLYINRKFEMTVFTDIDFTKRWFPSLSIYKGATVLAEFSPHWRPEGYMNASTYEFNTPELPISVNRLLAAMRSFSSSNLPPQDIYDAIMVALTPIYAMPY